MTTAQMNTKSIFVCLFVCFFAFFFQPITEQSQVKPKPSLTAFPQSLEPRANELQA